LASAFALDDREAATCRMGNTLADLRLALSPEDLALVRRALAERMREGAAADGGEIAMLPAWLAPPRAGLHGEAVAIDAGGTHLRAARVAADGDGRARIVGAILEEPLPGAARRPAATADELFAAHARVVARLAAPKGLPIGYCFSYPAAVRPDGDATLLRWTKEVRVAGVEGELVGALLREHLQRGGLVPGPVFVLNDTIATLEAGAHAMARGGRAVGLIVGTGSNVGAYLPVALLSKLSAPGWASERMAVNFESGAFSPPGLGPVDADVDAASVDPGAQRFEKAVAGAYLGRVLEAAALRLGIALPRPAIDAAEVSRLAEEAAGSPAGTLARAVLDRSADLVAAVLAATSDVLGGDGPLQVYAEGSLIAKAPGFAARVQASLGRMLAPGQARITLGDGANLVGSALAALDRG
jgi:hexokinase